MAKQKIVPHLWFNKEAVEAAEFYTSIFKESTITHKSKNYDTPSGDCDIVGFSVQGFHFMAISAGPLFKFNPSISFMLNIDPAKNKDAKKFETLTYIEALSLRLAVMDSTAISLCMENKLPILVLNLWDNDALHKAIEGKKIGTLVSK